MNSRARFISRLAENLQVTKDIENTSLQPPSSSFTILGPENDLCSRPTKATWITFVQKPLVLFVPVYATFDSLQFFPGTTTSLITVRLDLPDGADGLITTNIGGSYAQYPDWIVSLSLLQPWETGVF